MPDIAQIENLMYVVSNLFMLPVLLAIIALFIYAFYSLGAFSGQWFQRRSGRRSFMEIASGKKISRIKGYPLLNYYLDNPDHSSTDLEMFALRQVKSIRIITRVAPMLGLVATMIPMGPALKALANGNVQGISENLIIAFTAVIFGLITASITFWIASVRTHWLLEENRVIEKLILPTASLPELADAENDLPLSTAKLERTDEAA